MQTSSIISGAVVVAGAAFTAKEVSQLSDLRRQAFIVSAVAGFAFAIGQNALLFGAPKPLKNIANTLGAAIIGVLPTAAQVPQIKQAFEALQGVKEFFAKFNQGNSSSVISMSFGERTSDMTSWWHINLASQDESAIGFRAGYAAGMAVSVAWANGPFEIKMKEA